MQAVQKTEGEQASKGRGDLHWSGNVGQRAGVGGCLRRVAVGVLLVLVLGVVSHEERGRGGGVAAGSGQILASGWWARETREQLLTVCI